MAARNGLQPAMPEHKTAACQFEADEACVLAARKADQVADPARLLLWSSMQRAEVLALELSMA